MSSHCLLTLWVHCWAKHTLHDSYSRFKSLFVLFFYSYNPSSHRDIPAAVLFHRHVWLHRLKRWFVFPSRVWSPAQVAAKFPSVHITASCSIVERWHWDPSSSDDEWEDAYHIIPGKKPSGTNPGFIMLINVFESEHGDYSLERALNLSFTRSWHEIIKTILKIAAEVIYKISTWWISGHN